ncbi:MAG TPA: 16S rRNA (cytidine(1402)-2'-O)-methyltransferase [Blastocatellia bacterium]|nr:16S rRNA (cytidine(1402)-2'-O)-methyltransferase [Blastocatellia bacterium]
MSGTLFIVATPIGNLEDITLRALRVLKEADLIACEDTRHTRKLLSHYQISKPTVSYHEHNEHHRTSELIARLEAGANVALVSDAGTPLVSDPGLRVVQEAIEHGIPVVPIPGASAFVAAVAASGLSTEQFVFAGFLPSKQTARRARLAELRSLPMTIVFYEAPHRIKQALADAREMLPGRAVVIARELTKLHEEFIRSGLSEIELPEGARGEIVLLFGPPSPGREDEVQANRSVAEDVEELMRVQRLDQKTALKRVARARGIGKSEAYRQMLGERESDGAAEQDEG